MQITHVFVDEDSFFGCEVGVVDVDVVVVVVVVGGGVVVDGSSGIEMTGTVEGEGEEDGGVV